MKLKGKKALITGGSKGIGLAIKRALEKEGVKCYSWSRSEGVDLHKGIPLERFNELYNVDILINNFGGGGTWDWKDARMVMDKNYGLTEFLTRKFLEKHYDKNWLGKKHYREGRVITISSIYGKEKGHNPEFAAAKAAQIAFMKSLAGKYGEVTFNTICPGHIDVGKQFPDNPEVLGKPEDVAGIVVFLCSNKAKHINGACITCDGGESNSF